MRNRLLKALVLLSLAAILVGMPLLLTPHRIRTNNILRIPVNLTEPELEQRLGAKAGRYDGYDQGWFSPEQLQKELSRNNGKLWCSRYAAVIYYFDKDGRSTMRLNGPSVPASWWAKLVHRLLPPKDDVDWSK